MLTVVLACEASGNSSTRRPLPRRYSVMPSTDGPWLTPGGSAACALQHNAARTTAAHRRRINGREAIMGAWLAGKGADYTSSLTATRKWVGNGPLAPAKVLVGRPIRRPNASAQNRAQRRGPVRIDVYVNVI